MACCPCCPICNETCDITEEDLIDADCGACGQVQLHIECKEKYCRQQGIPKGQYKGYTCPVCRRAKVSAQHIRHKEKKKKAAKVVEEVYVETHVPIPILDAEGLLQAVDSDHQADPTVSTHAKDAYIKLLRCDRSLRTELEHMRNWRAFSQSSNQKKFADLVAREAVRMEATSLLKIINSTHNGAPEYSELLHRRLQLAQFLLDAVPSNVIEDLDQGRDSDRCLPLYNHVVGRLNALRAKCETAQHYLAQLRGTLGEQVEEEMWPWCDAESQDIEGRFSLSFFNHSRSSEQNQILSPPLYAAGVPWAIRLFQSEVDSVNGPCVAVYLDATYALFEDSHLEKRVTFAFALCSAGHSFPQFRKEATFKYGKEARFRGWQNYATLGPAWNGPIELSVEICEGAIEMSKGISISIIVDGCEEVCFPVKQGSALSNVLDSYCSRQHLRPANVIFKYLNRALGTTTNVEAEQTPSDLGMLNDKEYIFGKVNDKELEMVMKKTGCSMPEVAEALDNSEYQPRKAIQLLESSKKALAAAAESQAKLTAQSKAPKDGEKGMGTASLQAHPQSKAEATSAKGKKKIKGTKLVLTQVCLAPFQAFAELTLHGAIVRHVDEICSLFSLRQLSNFER
mmetsp:Transcript_55072/g.130279  ORF Transcript_55072/g.130279 Transcript_55072/m.130279 type:complete len:624 (+) Transcript_55072:73-1944(+)